ncbi:hypothetical protein BGW38_006682 [Lunasporangiospora selenospora]|uniref:Uncharacterized protein n=1 Tax=Lunasporangiospora selenospora TaxID=979761 RepID=A0A9P6G3F6_9FUNG|nr:hypothetical protein BGW38_006682 [Lunasporangiospora selenospora]
MSSGSSGPVLDLSAMATLGQCIKWTIDGHDILSMFVNFRGRCGNPQSVAIDYVADLADCLSDFELFLSQERHLSPALALQRDVIDDVMREWPILESRLKQLCPEGTNFDDVYSNRRGVLLDDEIADYASKIILSYYDHFRFSNEIPTDLCERQGFSQCTWVFISSALHLVGVRTRYSDVYLEGVDIRKNDMRDFMTEAKEYSQLADGVGIYEGQQIYIAEAGLLFNPKPDKQYFDLYKLKRCMRDAWISQVKALSLECQPPSGMSVFGSVSCASKTTFYKMDFVGAFRFYAVNNMVIPLSKKDFGSKTRRCMTACLEFSYLVKEEMARRSTAKHASFGDRQLLQAACAKIPATSVAPRKLKRTRSKVEGTLETE